MPDMTAIVVVAMAAAVISLSMLRLPLFAIDCRPLPSPPWMHDSHRIMLPTVVVVAVVVVAVAAAVDAAIAAVCD